MALGLDAPSMMGDGQGCSFARRCSCVCINNECADIHASHEFAKCHFVLTAVLLVLPAAGTLWLLSRPTVTAGAM